MLQQQLEIECLSGQAVRTCQMRHIRFFIFSGSSDMFYLEAKIDLYFPLRPTELYDVSEFTDVVKKIVSPHQKTHFL